jgi:hypothetical protein
MQKIRELLTDESKWTQGALARDALGRPVSACSAQACRWDLYGAMDRCYGVCVGPWTGPWALLLARIDREETTVSTWNDTHSFSDVRNLVVDLDI